MIVNEEPISILIFFSCSNYTLQSTLTDDQPDKTKNNSMIERWMIESNRKNTKQKNKEKKKKKERTSSDERS